MCRDGLDAQASSCSKCVTVKSSVRLSLLSGLVLTNTDMDTRMRLQVGFKKRLAKCIIVMSIVIVSMAWLKPAVAADVNEFIDVSADIPGRLYVPDTYASESDQEFPLILFLHGLGEGGGNNVDQVNGNINNLFAEAKRREVFLFAPQVPINNGFWNGSRITSALSMLTQIEMDYQIDKTRIYVTGLSAGGQGVWHASGMAPDRFAAAVPIAALRPNTGFVPSVTPLTTTPTWAYHAQNDPTVGKGETRLTVNAMLDVLGQTSINYPTSVTDTTFDARLNTDYYDDGSLYFEDATGILRHSEFSSGGHGIWGRVYAEAPMYEWMFSQSLSVPEPGAVSMMLVGMALAFSRSRVLHRRIQH